MKILITGAGGFFGRALVKEFAAGGHDVVAADILEPGDFKPRSDTPGTPDYVQLDVADPDSWTKAPKVDGVVHAAALTPSVEESQHDPSRLINVNLVGVLNALEFVRKNEVSKFLFVSSGGVYNQFDEETLSEADADGGFSLYGSAKLAAEILIFRYSKMFGFDAGAIRPTSMYGPAEEFRNTRPFVTEVKLLADAAAAGTPIQVERGNSRCDWVFVDDVAAASVKFFGQQMDDRVFNMSSGNPRPFSEVVAAAQAAFGLEVSEDAATTIDGGPDRPTVITPERAVKELDWNPSSLEDGLRRYAELAN